MSLNTFIGRKAKLHAILLNSLLGLTILWGPSVSADPVDAAADLVFGQPDFTSNTPNNGGISASSLANPVSVDLDFGGNLFVADPGNNRVLLYFFPKGTDKIADLVLGQPNLGSNAPNNPALGPSSLSNPTDLILDAAGNLYVADSNNHRVLVYLDPINTDTVADLVLGQPNFVSRIANNGGVSASSLVAPGGLALDAAGNLYVADTNNRVLVYLDPLNTDTVADVVFGQPNFTSNTFNNGGVSASSLRRPTGVHVDDAGNIWVADQSNHRVLEYKNSPIPDTVADVVLGQPDFISNTINNGGVSAVSLNFPNKLIVDIFGNIYVAELFNHRVLVYDGFLPALNIDFGAAGIWMRNNSNWLQLHPRSPETMVTGDLDGDGPDELVVDFGAAGIWVRLNNGSWVQLHSLSPESMVTGDLDNNGQDEVIIDFGRAGIWIWQNNSSWVKLHPRSPETMVTGDLDNNGQDELIVDFGAAGIWIWQNNSSWVKLHPGSPESMVTGDLDGNGLDELIMDFGASGLWIRLNNSIWVQLHPRSPESMVTGDLDGNGQDDLVVDFGRAGLWIWKNNSSFMKLHPLSPESMVTVDLDDNGRDDLVVDFGRAGLWIYRNNSTWEQLHTRSPETMVGIN